MIEKRTAITAEEPQLRKLAYMIDFSRTWALPIILMIVILGSIGFVSSENSDWHSPAVWSDSIYRSIQMFGLNFDLKAPNGERSNITLDIARYLAAISIFYGAFLVLGKSLAKSIMLRWVKLLSGWSDYVIVLGYGPVGQALARHEALEGAQVVAIDIRVDDVMRQVSTNDNVLLIEGDASTTHTLVYRLGVAKAKRIYISLSTDMQTLDSVRFLTGLIPGDGRSIRAFFNDPELSFRIPAAGEAGLSIARKARTWSVHKLAAQDLCAVEDLGTVAIEANADRVHVVIFGCGSQGMSILQEVLTTCWRVGLAPPAVTVFDREANRIRNRLRSSAASLFSDIQGTEPIPEASRPILHFEYGDLENFDFTKNNSFSDKLQKYSATAFILATGSDTLNLKSALALQDAMQKMTISPAPIYVRIWNTHMGSAANAGFATTSLMRQFGGLDETIAKAKSLRGDPDVSAVELNRIYDAVTSAINRQSPPEKMESWATLSETKKVANRALFRHMPTKIRDIGLQWRASPNPLPKVDLSFVKRFCDAEDALDYTKAERGVPLPPGWVRSGVANLSLSPDAELAYKIKEVAITEHDRWMTERALDGWQPAGYYTTSARDDQRKRHNCMVDWKDLLGKNTTDDLRIRKYDAALLRGIIEQPGAEAYDIFGSERATAYPRSACNLTMSMEKSTGSIYEWEIKEGPMRIPAICTEVFVKIACRKPPRQLHYRLQGAWGNYDKATDGLEAAGAGLLKAFVDWQSTADDNGSLCRVVFVFDHPEELWRSAIIEPLASVLKDNKIHVSTKYTWSSN